MDTYILSLLHRNIFNYDDTIIRLVKFLTNMFSGYNYVNFEFKLHYRAWKTAIGRVLASV